MGDYGVGIVTPCLNSINKTAVAVVAVKTAAESEADAIQKDDITRADSAENIANESFADLARTDSQFDVILLPTTTTDEGVKSEETARFRNPHWDKDDVGVLNTGDKNRHSYSDCDLYCMKSLEQSTMPLTPQLLHAKRHQNQSIFVIRNNFKPISPTRVIRKSSQPLDDPLSMRNATLDGCRI